MKTESPVPCDLLHTRLNFVLPFTAYRLLKKMSLFVCPTLEDNIIGLFYSNMLTERNYNGVSESQLFTVKP